ncbi:glycosyltransferase [Staphylococcus borealis]|uniref:glycosyltransferase n=1 Tax=Staphylococcus borealis TaxID=2742203 RepID=UPI0039EC9D2D
MLYTITSTLPPTHGGRTKSLLHRIQFLETQLGQTSTILTTNYNANYKNVYRIFRNKKLITDNTVIENIYDWLANYKLLEEPVEPKLFRKLPIQTKVKIRGLEAVQEGDSVKYYKDQTYVLFRRYYTDRQVVKFEDTINPNTQKIAKRKSFTLNGRLHKIDYFDDVTAIKTSEEYYDKKGNMYLKKHFMNNQKNQLIDIQHFTKQGETRIFKKEKALFTYYYNHVLADGSIVFNDARLLDRPLIECENNIKRILMFHSNHLQDHNVRHSYKLALDNHEKIDKYVVLTDYQKRDIQSQFDIDDNKIEVIPHFLDIAQSNHRDAVEDQFCFIGRLASEKQIDHIIKAFDMYLKKGYSSKLLVYGDDKEGNLNKLKQLVRTLQLEDKVIFKGHTNTPKEVFPKAIASLLTSRYEGFGLSIMESINCGCPVISYNVRYGPSELIRNHENGILVEKDDIEGFANAMEMARNIPFKDVKLSEKFSVEQALINYQSLINDVTHTMNN